MKHKFEVFYLHVSRTKENVKHHTKTGNKPCQMAITL